MTPHHLEHHHAVEFVTVAVGDLDRRRLMAKTDKGEEVAITLPRLMNCRVASPANKAFDTEPTRSCTTAPCLCSTIIAR